MDKTASGLVSSIPHIIWCYASRLCTLNSLTLQGIWHIPSVLCHTSTTLVGCSMILTLVQMHWNGTSSPILPKNQVSICRATWVQRNPRAKDVASEHWGDPALSNRSTAHSCHPSRWLMIAPWVPCMSRQRCCSMGYWPLEVTLGPGSPLTADKVQHPPLPLWACSGAGLCFTLLQSR